MLNAEQNIGKTDCQKRHSLILKKFCTLLLINAGSMAYDFIHKNMPEALPSLRKVQNIIHKEYTPFREGQFYFDGLLKHLKKHRAPYIVTIAEDATRIIKNVEYDAVSNSCIGFVLPVGSNGVPLTDSLTVTFFEGIENYFAVHTMAKYAYVYMVQPLKEGVPPFCLACIGSDNKFNADDVLQRWQYINSELSLRGVRVINFAADGDSRLLKAMRVTTQLTSSHSSLSLNNKSTSFCTHKDNFSVDKWLCTKLYSIFCVQDMVHIAVKFKTRLLKPTIMLPMGCYLASSAHLKIVMSLYGKDVHGIRKRDLDSRDKQNYAAIEHLIKASPLLESIPDAVATKIYLEIVDSSVNSYLDRSYSPSIRLGEYGMLSSF